MKIWDSISTLMVRPLARVPWGYDRGVNDAEYARYRGNFQRGVIAYFAALLFVDIVGAHVPVMVRYAAAVLPFAACAFVLYALVRYVGHWDELQRRIIAEAGALASVAGIGLLLTYNYLMDIGLPPIAPKWMAAIFAVLWFIAVPLLRRSYEAS
jgi:hypothetical protein